MIAKALKQLKSQGKFWALLGGYGLAAVIFTFPLIFNLKSFILGDIEGDVWKHSWGFWWIKDSIMTTGRFPLQTELMNAPYGGNIYFIDPLGALVSIPLQLLFGLVAAYNLMIFFYLLVGGLGGYYLARYLTKNDAAAFLAGIIFAFCPYVLAYLNCGVTEPLNYGWIPLVLLFFIRTLKERRLSNAVWAGVFFFLAAFGCMYYGSFAFIMALLVLGYFYADKYAPVLRPKIKAGLPQLKPAAAQAWAKLKGLRAQITSRRLGLAFLFIGYLLVLWKVFQMQQQSRAIEGARYLLMALGLLILYIYNIDKYILDHVIPWIKRLPVKKLWVRLPAEELQRIKRLVFMALVTGVLLIPVIYAYVKTFNEPHSMVFRVRGEEYVDFYLSNAFYNISKVVDYFMPGKANVVRTYTVDKLVRCSYVGYITLVLGLLGACFIRRRWVRLFSFSALLFAVLALGPFLYVTDTIRVPFKTYPYMWFYRYMPFFPHISIPYRFIIMVLLCLALLGAYALARWFRGMPRRTQWLWSGSLAFAVLFEVMLISPAPYPIPLSSTEVPAYAREMAKDRQMYGVIDLPIQRSKGTLLIGEYFYYQTVHHKRLPNKVEGTIPLYVFQNPLTFYMFNIEQGFQFHMERATYALERAMLQKGVKDLKKNKFKYIIVHNNYFAPRVVPEVHKILSYFFGPPKDYGRGIQVYQVYQ